VASYHSKMFAYCVVSHCLLLYKYNGSYFVEHFIRHFLIKGADPGSAGGANAPPVLRLIAGAHNTKYIANNFCTIFLLYWCNCS